MFTFLPFKQIDQTSRNEFERNKRYTEVVNETAVIFSLRIYESHKSKMNELLTLLGSDITPDLLK